MGATRVSGNEEITLSLVKAEGWEESSREEGFGLRDRKGRFKRVWKRLPVVFWFSVLNVSSPKRYDRVLIPDTSECDLWKQGLCRCVSDEVILRRKRGHGDTQKEGHLKMEAGMG